VSAELLQAVATTFGLLSATARVHLLWLLAGGERDVGSLAEDTGHSVATVSHHLSKLKLAGLVRARRAGKHQFYLLADEHIVDILGMALRHHLAADGKAPRRLGHAQRKRA
jgi:DNA-binding transcriptional ArsR family regulator